MLAGHFTTALIAKQQAARGPIAYFLVVSQLPDLLWLLFHFVGLEPTEPDNVMSVSLDRLSVDMLYSHDLLPVVGWVVAASLVGRVAFASWRVGLFGGALVAVHSLIDNLTGYPHHLFGPDTVAVSTGMYRWSPYLAVGIEAAFIALTLAWVVLADRRAAVRRTLRTWVVRVAVFVGGAAFMFSVADLSMAEATGLEPPQSLSGSTVPIMVSVYLTMLIALVWGESQPVHASGGGAPDARP